MTTQSRRQFLKLTAASLALMASGSASRWLTAHPAFAEEATPRGRELILLCDSDTDIEANNHLRVTNPGSIKIYDVESGEVSAIELPFFGHIVNQHPKYSEQAVTFEKWGKRGALVDLKNKKILSMLEPADGKTFFGHAAFSTDGSAMVTTENNYEETEGLLAFRDTSDMKIVGKYSSYGMIPHECRTPDNGKTIMVVNKGDKKQATNPKKSVSNLAWIDWNSGKLINKVEFNRYSNVLYGHCDVSFDSWVCVSGLSVEDKFFDMIVFISPDGHVHPAKLPKDIVTQMKGEALSIAFLGKSGLVGVTVTKANLVLLIDYKKQTLVDAVSIGVPNGILPILDGNDTEPSMWVSSKKNRNIAAISMKKGAAPDVKTVSTNFGGIGTHLSRIFI